MSYGGAADRDGYVQLGARRFHVEFLRDAAVTVEGIAEMSGLTVEQLVDWARGPGLVLGLRWGRPMRSGERLLAAVGRADLLQCDHCGSQDVRVTVENVEPRGETLVCTCQSCGAAWGPVEGAA